AILSVFCKSPHGKGGPQWQGTGNASGKQTGMRGVFAPFPASPKTPTAEPIPSGSDGKTPSSCNTPLYSALTMNRGGPAHGPPRFPVFADCPMPPFSQGKNALYLFKFKVT
ncbi:MAG: hypothetical protein ACLVIW_12075, partial [Bilophila wadsworthia]